MAINIWLASWNCENQAPSDTMLNNFMVTDVNAALPNPPDLIVVGLQEADITSTFNREFVSDRLAKTKRLGNNYQQIGSAYTVGFTKGKKNYLQIGVLCRNQLAITNKQTGTYKDGTEGKGGVFVKFDYTDNNNNVVRLGFINAHLDSKNAAKRESQIKGLLREITGSDNNDTVTQIEQALTNQFDAVFFMGDLNYRLKTFQDLQNNPVFSNSPINNTIQIDPNFPGLKNLGENTKVDTLVNWIFNPNLRGSLANLDSLYASSLVGGNNPNTDGYGFTFPPAGNLLPTYKRFYKDRTAANPCSLLAAGNSTAQNIRGCYFNGLQATDPVPYNQKRQAFELGWLDRIGYKAKVGVPVQSLTPGQVLQLESKDGIVLSDHTPVLLKVQVG
jgi:endonuclease/exonuclease/phosphatase family metal-dependent hydrolase